MSYGACIALAMGILSTSLAHATALEPIAALEGVFENPPREYSTGPLWVWNDMLSEDQIHSTLRDLAGQNVKQVWVHPRPGLMTPYLSEDWFRLWEAALDEAERLDMNVWIYDENSYPSGFAGGFVPEAMPESRGMGIELRKIQLPGDAPESVLAVYGDGVDGPEDVTQAFKQDTLAEGEYRVIVQTEAGSSPWFGGTFYVDLLRPDVTEKFLELTLEPYRERFAEQFGKRIPGVFTDEPHLAPAAGLHWTPDLAARFQERWGYDLRHEWLSLWEPVGDWRRVRHNYYQTLLDLFVERWAKPYFEYCEANNLEFTGHYWEHEWPGARIGPDNMAMYAWHQRPAIDTLFNQYSEDVHSQFGNVRAVLELSSVANQTGKRRTLCEAYGGSGWDARFEDFKRIGDWLEVLGVNTINEHLSQITNRGARKADYPPSFSYHAPWFPAYHVLANHFTRLSAAMSHGEQINEILVLEPTTTAWMYQGDREKLNALGNEFQRLVTTLAQAQVEFDLGSEHLIAEQGAVRDGRFVVGRRAYHTVVIPPSIENLNQPTLSLIENFVAGGGTVINLAEGTPTRVDGNETALGGASSWSNLSPDQLIPTLLERMGDAFQIVRDDGGTGILYHHRRQFVDGDLVLLVNTSIDSAASGKIETRAGAAERWDTEAGVMHAAYPFVRNGELTVAEFDLPPCGSLLLFFPNQSEATAAESPSVATSEIAPISAMTVSRRDPNVLTLDYVDVKVGGESKESVYFYQAAEQIFKAHGLDQNPWDHAVQFGDQLIAKTFGPESGFEASYRFTVRDLPATPVYFVMERADLYAIACNGQAIAPQPGEWWLDRAFNKIDISACVQAGENRITVAARPFTMFHELEPAYLLGDFALEPTQSGFVIAADKPLDIGPWKAQGLPLYGAGVSYTTRFNVPSRVAGIEFDVTLRRWYGSVAAVTVNGVTAGHIWHAPWQCRVTDQIREGDNEITVTVIGTPKNTLGPHHGNPPLGFAGPNSFREGPTGGPPPGEQYHTLDYGLFEPFQLTSSIAAKGSE